MIPKTIHYCWFGRSPKPQLAKKCIKSWKKYCPDYEIIEWNEDNFDITAAPLYVRQAYEAKKWAFVTDYVRLWAMVNYGGIYMDTDVEVIKPLDGFLQHEAFSGFEDEENIPTGIMACEKGFALFREFMEHYDKTEFLNRDGSNNLVTNVKTITEHLRRYGLEQNNSFQVICGFALYPNDVFCPRNWDTGRLKTTENTVTIHWFNGSWFDEDAQKRKIDRWEKTKRADFWDQIAHTPNRVIRCILGKRNYEKVKKLLKRG